MVGKRGHGPYVTVELVVELGMIREVTCQCNGCPSSLACIATLEILLEGREIEKARKLTKDDLMLITKISESKEASAVRTIKALNIALDNAEDVA